MVTLVVLNFNDWKTTTSFVESIRSYKNIGRIIIVDNFSTDDSYDHLLLLRSDTVDVIQTKENKGYATGNNFGVRYALDRYSPEYVIISNPDVFFEERIVDVLYNRAKQMQNTGIISCKTKGMTGVSLQSAWKQPTYWSYLISNFPVLNHLIGEKETYTTESTSEIVEVDVLPGSFFMISAQAFQDINGFDERTFLYCEESIVSARLHTKGYKNYLVMDEEYLHMHSTTISKSFSSVKKRLCMQQESREIYCKEYLGIGPFRMFLFRSTFYFGLYEYLLLSKLKALFRHGTIIYQNEKRENTHGK